MIEHLFTNQLEPLLNDSVALTVIIFLIFVIAKITVKDLSKDVIIIKERCSKMEKKYEELDDRANTHEKSLLEITKEVKSGFALMSHSIEELKERIDPFTKILNDLFRDKILDKD